jgi:single-stranded DNA-binding protein
MSDINNCTHTGRLGSKVELIKISETTIATMSVAVNYTAKGKESVTWLRVKAFNGLAEVCSKYLEKGSQICFTSRYAEDRVEKEGEPTKYFSYFVMSDLKMFSAASSPTPPILEEKETTDEELIAEALEAELA